MPAWKNATLAFLHPASSPPKDTGVCKPWFYKDCKCESRKWCQGKKKNELFVQTEECLARLLEGRDQYHSSCHLILKLYRISRSTSASGNPWQQDWSFKLDSVFLHFNITSYSGVGSRFHLFQWNFLLWASGSGSEPSKDMQLYMMGEEVILSIPPSYFMLERWNSRKTPNLTDNQRISNNLVWSLYTYKEIYSACEKDP